MSVRRLLFLCLPALLMLLLTGCARFGPATAAATATAIAEPTFVPVPTFTPTAQADVASGDNAGVAAAAAGPVATESALAASAIDTPIPTEAADESVGVLDALLPTPTTADAANAPVADETVADETAADDVAVEQDSTEADGPRLVVSGEIVNVRQGPSTEYALVGSAAANEEFAPTGRNAAGDWWQVCCFADEPGWLYGELVTVEGGDAVAVAADIPPLPTPAAAAVAPADEAPTDETVPAEENPAPAAETPPDAPAEVPAPAVDSAGTAGNFDPNAQYQIVGYRVIGYGENNGGIFNNGGQHMIFINVRDAAGNGVDGAVIKNAIDDNVNIVTGSKGPGRAEFEMFWDPYKLYVASDPSGPVTSQITNQMNTAKPHIPDIVGRLGPPEEEYAICPTLDDRCEPPFFHAHWSYEVTFQKVQ